MFSLLKSKHDKDKKNTLFAVRSSFENLMSSSTVGSNVFFADLESDNKTVSDEPVLAEKIDTQNIPEQTTVTNDSTNPEFTESFIIDSIVSNNANHIQEESTSFVPSTIEESANDTPIPEAMPESNQSIIDEMSSLEIPDEMFEELIQEVESHNYSSVEVSDDVLTDVSDNNEENNTSDEDIEVEIIEEVHNDTPEVDETHDDAPVVEEIHNDAPIVEEVINDTIQVEEIKNEDINIEELLVNDYSDMLPEENIVQEVSNNITEESYIDNSVPEEQEPEKIDETVNIEEVELQDNNTLLISELDKKVFLPYTVEDIYKYLDEFPEKYSEPYHVIRNEFVLPLNYFNGFFQSARFREAYALYRDREGYSFVEAIVESLKIMSIKNLHPAIITACKNQKILNDYLYHLDHNDLENFKFFEIKYRINPK